MEFRVLGPLEVLAGGRVVAVGGSRERAVLARLLVSANQVVAQETLVDDLWPAEAPEGGAQALWVYVSRLRKALREAGGDDVLVTKPPGYVLAVDPDAFDAARFEAGCRAARLAAAEGRHADAAAGLTGALALWRGPAYSGVTDLPFARAEADRLAEARLTAVEARIEADLATGAERELIGELASLTREHPLRERLWALRMTALYRAGRQAEALRTYQELRRYLGEELGIEPSEELRTLEAAILRQETHLARPQPEGGALVAAEPAGPEVPSGVVTFMFTDLVGSTELLDRLGDEAADELRRRHFSALRQALKAHGGSEVKSLGDGLMAAFASPAAALRCAVEIQQATAAASGAGGGRDPDLAVRVGIHAGEPIAEDDDFFGAPVVVAQRLCGRARGGQILVSALVQGLAGSRAGCSFAALGGLTLKGFAEPVAASEVRWAPAGAAALPLPVPLQRQDALFVRPEADMARLEAAWEAARSGRRQLVLLAGEPGIGKTRRSAEIARLAQEAGAAVLHGRCEEGMGVPYQPFVEALATYLRQAPTPVLGRLAGELARLVPELAQRFPDLPAPLAADPDTERYRLFDAVAAWLAALAAETPAVLVVEDIHWATPPTLAMLGHLVRSGEPGRLLVVVNYRDTPLDVTPALADAVADLLRQPDVDRLHLGGLDRAGVAAYMEAQARHELDADGQELAGVLHAETAGNPFFLNQVLRHLGETGALTQRDGRWSMTGAAQRVAVPDSVRDVIAQRLARLPDDTGEILTLAAVQGDQFDLRIVVEAAGQPQMSVLQALDPAISARLVTEADGPVLAFRFVHALVRHTLYDALPAARRMELHRAVGEALAALAGDAWPEHATDLARHWLTATPQIGATAAEAARTLDYAEEAARRATVSLAYEEAATQLARALPLADALGDPRRRAAMLVALGEAQYNAGDSAHRQTLHQAAELAAELGDGTLAARAALANQRPMTFFGAIDPDRIALLERVLASLAPGDSDARARLLVALAAELHHSEDPRRSDFAREAVTVARRVGDPACLAHVLGMAVFAVWEPATLAERLAMASEADGLATRLADPVLQFNAALALYYSAATAGDIDRSRAVLDRAADIADTLGQPSLQMRAAYAQTASADLDGRYADAIRFAGQALHYGELLGNHDVLGAYRTHVGVPLLLQGRPAEAIEHLQASADRLPLAGVKIAVSWACAEAGQRERARAFIDDLGGPRLPGIPRRVYVGLASLVFAAGTAAALGDADMAEQFYRELLPWREQFCLAQGGAFGPMAYFLGLLAAATGRIDEAIDHMAFAADVQERTGTAGMLARTRLDWARLLLERGRAGDADAARQLAAAAAELADELGATALAERALELLATTGVR